MTRRLICQCEQYEAGKRLTRASRCKKYIPNHRKETALLKVYCYSRCTTCKKALKWLDDHNVPYSSVDISTSHPDIPTLREYVHFSGLPLKKFFNTSGNAYRALNLAEKLPGIPEEEQLALLASDGMLVKQPLAVGEDYVLIGFKEKEWAKRLL